MDFVSRAALTALDAVSSLNNSTVDIPAGDGDVFANGTDVGEVFGNGTIVSPVNVDVIDEGSYVLNTILGLLIVLVASCLNALGLNLTKLDHIRQQSIPKSQRKRDIFRVLWLAGMGTYIASQVFGSPMALKYLRPDWVAPLGSSSLIFNFIFAYWLVGTPVTSTDIKGTAVIVFGVILILIFSSINHGLSQTVDIATLNMLWSRPSWLAWFAFSVFFNGMTFFISHILASLVASRASFSPLPSPTIRVGQRAPSTNPVIAFFARTRTSWNRMEKGVVARMEKTFVRSDDARLIWLQGIGWGVCGGTLAGLCLVFTKAVVKIFWLPGHPFVHPSAFMTLLLVIATAILQIVCLNRALECTDTVVVVPLFYAGYTVFGFINALIFFDQTKQYARWVLVATFIGISVLISGVVLLSLKASAKTASDPYTVTTESDSIHLRPRQPRSKDASRPKDGDEETGPAEIMWEVGSVSDSEDGKDGRDEAPDKRRGTSQRGGRGEQRGLLGDEEDESRQ